MRGGPVERDEVGHAGDLVDDPRVELAAGRDGRGGRKARQPPCDEWQDDPGTGQERDEGDAESRVGRAEEQPTEHATRTAVTGGRITRT